MKKLIILSLVFLTSNVAAYTTGFQSYIGVDAGLNIGDYTQKTDLNDTYYSATVNIGIRINRNFGTEFFFSHSSTNNLEFVYDLNAINHEVYYMVFGFDIFAYYPLSKNADFFTTFGVANHKIYNKYEYITETNETNIINSNNDISTRLGIGFLYTFPGNKVSGVIRYNYTPINNDIFKTMSKFSFGIRYVF